MGFFDDFLGDVIADQWNYVEGTDSATSTGAILSGGIGGVLRLTSGDAGTGLAADAVQLTGELQWQASNGGLVAETRIKLSRITTAFLFFGFTDLAATLECPIESAASADTITTNASDAVGFMFDTRMATDDFWAVGVKADVDATKEDLLVAPAANEYITLRVAVDSLGVATFFVNGAQVGSSMADAVTPGADLTPVIYFSPTSVAASITADVDYVMVGMDRAANGGTV